MRKSFVSAFSAAVAILLSLGFYLNISAIDVTFEVTLIEPVSVTAEGDTLSDSERQEIGARIQAFTQTAIDAFGADLPGIKFWVDPPSSSFS